MLDNIYGKIERKELDRLILNNGGIGYRIFASDQTLKGLKLGESYRIFLEMIVREDMLNLYGFIDEREREVYRLLTKVRNIGPKVAIGILSGLDVDDLISAIRTEDIAILTQAPGVGRKTAERIILELREKTDHISIEEKTGDSDLIRQAEEALEHLGYLSYESKDLLQDIYQDNMTLEELIRQALKTIAR